jgi:hypothetical protein
LGASVDSVEKENDFCRLLWAVFLGFHSWRFNSFWVTIKCCFWEWGKNVVGFGFDLSTRLREKQSWSHREEFSSWSPCWQANGKCISFCDSSCTLLLCHVCGLIPG